MSAGAPRRLSTLYLTDLDGTLFDDTPGLSERTRTILNRLLDEGLLFSVATARSAASALEKLEGLRLRLPVALMNGVLLFRTDTRTYVGHTAIDCGTAARVMDAMEEFGQSAYVFTFAQGQLYANFRDLSTPHQRQFCEERRSSGLKRFERVDRFRDLLGRRDVIFFSVTGAYEELLPLCERVRAIGGGLDVLMYEDFVNRIWYLEIFDARAGKAAALRQLRSISGAEETVCFGDNYNDVEMMRAADRSYAVANAVDAARASATGVIGHHCSDAVALFIRDEWEARTR
ncbi:HAD family phosphatase [Clostridiaceae bacterium NSJ-31]|uniref:HAD family phosphatase n=1 Tax=Ligaoa zhengdingensis TaxID=2763658 RepID=A0A926DZ97_9FIRM|nr:HAD family phosphatase [Ligaoa zhengdingensis]